MNDTLQHNTSQYQHSGDNLQTAADGKDNYCTTYGEAAAPQNLKPSQSSSLPETSTYPPPDVKYFVGGFHSDVTEDDIRKYFLRYGPVSNVQIMRDVVSKRSRGFGFVTMANPTSKSAILAEKDHIIGNRRASVRPYTEVEEPNGPILKRKIFVGGVNPALGHEVLEKYFSSFGPLENATIMRYPDGRSRGFGFVVFRDENSCQQALQQRHHYITQCDRVEVKPCLSREKSRNVPVGEPPYGIRPMHHPYAGYYNYEGAGNYGDMYGQYYGAGNYGAPIPGTSAHGAAAGWGDYRDGWTAAHPYDVYGGYYGSTAHQGHEYGPAAGGASGGIPRASGTMSSGVQPTSTLGSSRNSAVDGNYYHMAGGVGNSAIGSMGMSSYNPYSHIINGASNTSTANLSTNMGGHPGYNAMRRGANGLPPTTPATRGNMNYTGIPRGRATPY